MIEILLKVAINTISLEKTDRSIKNGKLRETGNIGHKKQNEDNQERERKYKRCSTRTHKKRGEPTCSRMVSNSCFVLFLFANC